MPYGIGSDKLTRMKGWTMTASNHYNEADKPEPVPEEQRKLEKLRHKGEEVREQVKETEKEVERKIEK
jgi:hypothetical protein